MQQGRQPLIRRPVVRILLIWAFQTVGLSVMAFLLDGLTIQSVTAAVLAAGAIGLLNSLLWPVLSYILVPFAVFTLGILALMMNAVIVWLAAQFVDGFEILAPLAAVWTAIGLSLTNVIASTLMTIDDDSAWYRNVVSRRVKRMPTAADSEIPGVLFLEVDGLSRPVLEKAMANGYAPVMKRWLEKGSHRLVEWETDLSSQTLASQAGILHGNNDNIPGFRWYNRARGVIVSSNNADDLATIEERQSDGNGLLVDNGASRGNLLSGDAPYVSVTASMIKDLSRFHMHDYYAYFVQPYNLARTLLLAAWELFLEFRQFNRARRKNIQPRLGRRHRGGLYPFLRVFTTIILRELNIYTLIGDIYSGVSVAYATFAGYDEVAHHSGVESNDALEVLRKLDEQFGRLENAAKNAPRPYHLVILSDHGQSPGATFLQRYGLTLQQLLQGYIREHLVHGIKQTDEARSYVNVFLTDIKYDERSGRAISRVVERSKKGAYEKHASAEAVDESLLSDDGLLVLASGNLGLVYGINRKRRITLEEIEHVFPGLLEGLARHEGIGFILVNSHEHGAVVVGGSGRAYLDCARLEGEDPLEHYGPNAAEHLMRYNQFKDAPDLYINSFYNPHTNEVAAFEELIGCHGGMGGDQTRPFVLYPAGWRLHGSHIVGAPALYVQFKQWLAELQLTSRIESVRD